MSIILDKIIECKIFGKQSIKNNCKTCYFINYVNFKDTIALEEELINFSCDNCIKIISVEVKE